MDILGRLTDLGVNLLAGLIGFVIGRGWERLKAEIRSRRARRLWKPFVTGDSRIVLGRVSGLPEKTGFLAVGDAMALAALQAYFESLNLPHINFEYDDYLHGDNLKSDLILIGGPAVNAITKEALSRISSKSRFGTPMHTEAVYDSATDREYVPSRRTDSNEISVDYGMIIKTKNPFDPSKQVLVIAGSWGYGTWAGARFAISKEFSEDPVVLDGKSFECLIETDVVRRTPQDTRVVFLRPLEDEKIASPTD
jgi:hypothetical protein